MKIIVVVAVFIIACSFFGKVENEHTMSGKIENEKVSVLLKFKAANGKKQELIDHLTKTIKLTSMNEEGTEIHTVSTSSIDDFIYVYEVFSNKEATTLHQSSEAYKKARLKIDSLLAGPPEVVPLMPQGGKGLKGF